MKNDNNNNKEEANNEPVKPKIKKTAAGELEALTRKKAAVDSFAINDIIKNNAALVNLFKSSGFDYATMNPSLNIGSTNYDNKLKLEEEINILKKELSVRVKNADEKTKLKQDELDSLKKEIQSKEKINHILPRICSEAGEKLFKEESFKELFEDSKTCDAVVVSIDIRRSTELMLKARKPELFSKFITELSAQLSSAIIANYGIFDKFTGDGILAFFPKHFSGKSAMLMAIKAAEECHEIFAKHYNESRDCFNVFIKDIGLGIGIDYGQVTLVNNGNELTVVGIPVVYACRMSSANAGETLLNQPALEEILILSNNDLKITETEIAIKHEGMALAYKVEVLKNLNDIDKPDWF